MRRLATPAGIAPLLALLGASTPDGIAAPVPVVESVAILEERPLPHPGGAASGFRLGGMSDLVVAADASERELGFWAITDRGPNGAITEPAAEGVPPKTRRTLPLPGFAPLLVRLSVPVANVGGPASARVVTAMPLSTSAGVAVSGRPAAADPRAKPIVDPATLAPVPVDPDGFDSEGLARTPDGRFWVAEEYLPSIAEFDADGRLRRRLVPRGVALAGATCPVQDSLPADLARRRDNRGFESLALAPDGSRLFALLQSPLEPEAPAAGVAPDLDVPLVVLDASSGSTLEEHAYRLGGGDGDTCDWCVAAADGKVSAVAAVGPRTLLVLEQSDVDLRVYRVDLVAGSARAEKRLVADLAPLAADFHRSIAPGATGAPARLSDLKFEGMAVVGPDRVALVNDNDFDIAADGAAAASPPARRTCLWVLRLPGPIE